MKRLFYFLAFNLFLISWTSAQSFVPIKDPNYKGVKVYTNSGYTGSSTSCTSLKATYTFKNGIGSVKVYGAWKLVPVQSGVAILEDDPNYNASGGGSWKLEKTNDMYHGIAYSQTSYSGQATYLKMGKTENLHEPIKSIKLKVPASIGWTHLSGYQQTYQDSQATLPYDIARVDIGLKYLANMSATQKVTN